MSADDSGDELDLQERFARAEQLQRAAAELQVQPERSPEEVMSLVSVDQSIAKKPSQPSEIRCDPQIKQEQMELFATERIRLLSDHGYIALVLTSLVWLECPLKTTASFALGAEHMEHILGLPALPAIGSWLVERELMRARVSI